MCYVPRGLTWRDSLSVVAEGHFACIHGGVVQQLRDQSDWYLSNFVAGFCVLVQHNIHDELPGYQSPGVTVKYIECTQVPKVPMTQADVKIFHQVMHFVSTVYDHSNFTVLLFDLEACHVTVYDGLPCNLKKWENHISYILWQYGLHDY
jgi:hypothetical protein